MTDRDYRTEPLKVTDRDPMDDFVREDVTLLGETRRVYRTGNGPAVIVMAEMPGIYAHVIRFARMVRDAGFSVWMPALFGTEGGPVTMAGGAATMIRACISREFRAFAADRSSPITAWLRALAAHALPLCGGRGVGAIGM
ncbi:MAG: dienelactone hydrolase, partial [Pseudomonadales bacterium]